MNHHAAADLDHDDIGFLAEVLIDRIVPLDVDLALTVFDFAHDHGPDRHLPPPTGTTDADRWALIDDSPTGRIVTPDKVLRLRRRFRSANAGVSIDGSEAVYYQTSRGFARSAAQALAGCQIAAAVQHRVEHFLELSDDDFLACFRFDDQITREYLDQANRCDAAFKLQGEPDDTKPRRRRQRKSDSLRSL